MGRGGPKWEREDAVVDSAGAALEKETCRVPTVICRMKRRGASPGARYRPRDASRCGNSACILSRSVTNGYAPQAVAAFACGVPANLSSPRHTHVVETHGFPFAAVTLRVASFRFQQPAALGDEIGHRRCRRAFLPISVQHASPVGFGPILAHLPFALDSADRDLNADYSLHLSDDEVGRSVIYLDVDRDRE
jgi:hypothetical protein